ncbi:MAG: preprotein translocase subunit SecE [Aphanocapsa feldmannii 277cV]|uniref:Protein translocase subunit SecE n=2 Tax=Aphanocapsa feldmannii TaxID=192050 RepID=A0A524RRC0_9CHRO|nr:MAG: preprotein translocase subunit SecE [Aphanocapsa feldmannii 288cV]TGG94691.1 MAG: preprotein translocase subunit SecE [Aphanocapsa feldmannii 277cV]TGH25603.1 MAG: preprotein translocase subunit SecE [Aphanocapsa feldmannii 277cI]
MASDTTTPGDESVLAASSGSAPIDDSAVTPPEGPRGFLVETIDELGKIVWPSRQQLVSESISVILMVVVSAAAIASASRLFAWMAQQVFPFQQS